jgi:SAM-dependent methyltransferase
LLADPQALCEAADLLRLRERHALLLNPAFRELLSFELDSHVRLCAAPTRKSRQALYASLYPQWSPLLRAFLASQATTGGALPQEGGLGFADVFLDWFRPWLAGRSILELGCGGGRSTRLLAKMTKPVVGLDVDPGLLNEARAACPQVDFLQSSLGLPLSFPADAFDTV